MRQRRIRTRLDVIRKIKGVKSVNADQQYMLNAAMIRKRTTPRALGSNRQQRCNATRNHQQKSF
jgi:hypothetical protein